MMNNWPENNKKMSVGPRGDGSVDGSKVDVLNNRIYYYSGIDDERILELNKYMRDLHNRNRLYAMNNELDPMTSSRIFLHIQSYGGSVFAGIAGMDTIHEVKQSVPVVTIVEGCAASAATFLSVVGTERWMRRNSYMLIHQLSSAFWGKYAEIKDEVENLDRLMDMIKRTYKDHTKVPMKQLDAVLKRDIWWDAKTCLQYGLVDKII